MIHISYIKGLMSAFNISQVDLAAEWGRLKEHFEQSGKKKHQSTISYVLSKKFSDSITMVRAISNLSGIPAGDIVNEVSWDKGKKMILFNQTGQGVPGYTEIPVIEKDTESGKVTLPKAWIEPGPNKISVTIGEGMTPTLHTKDLYDSVLIEEDSWKTIEDGKIYEITTKSNETFIRRVKNEIAVSGDILCYGDNPDKNRYPDFRVKNEDIKQVWKVLFIIKWSFPEPKKKGDDIDSVVEKLYEKLKSDKGRLKF